MEAGCVIRGTVDGRAGIHLAAGQGEEAVRIHLQAIVVRFRLIAQEHIGGSIAHGDREAFAFDISCRGADVTSRADMLQLQGLGTRGFVDGGRGDYPRIGSEDISAVCETCAIVDVGQRRLAVTFHAVAENVGGIFHQWFKVDGRIATGIVVFHWSKLPLSATAVVGRTVHVDGEPLAGHGRVEVLACHLVAGNGVIIVAAGLSVSSGSQLEVVMLGRWVIFPTSGSVVGGRNGVDRAFGYGLAHQSILAGIGGILLQAPPLVVIVTVSFGCLGIGPEPSCGSVLVGIGGEQRRAFCQQFDAAVLTCSICSAGYEAVEVLLFGRVHMGHHLVAAPFFHAEHMVFAIFIVAIIKQHGICRHTLPEILEVAIGLRSPASFGNGNKTGQREPLHVVAVAHVLGPESALHPVVRFGGDGLVIRFAHIV